MDHLRTLPAKKGELPVIPVDARAAEVGRSRRDKRVCSKWKAPAVVLVK